MIPPVLTVTESTRRREGERAAMMLKIREAMIRDPMMISMERQLSRLEPLTLKSRSSDRTHPMSRKLRLGWWGQEFFTTKRQVSLSVEKRRKPLRVYSKACIEQIDKMAVETTCSAKKCCQ